MFDHISARRLAGPPAGLPCSSSSGGSTRLPVEVHGVEQAASERAAIALLYKTLVDLSAEATDVDVDLCGLFLPHELRNPAGHLHGVEPIAFLDLFNAAAATPGNCRAVGSEPGGIDADNRRAASLEVCLRACKTTS